GGLVTGSGSATDCKVAREVELGVIDPHRAAGPERGPDQALPQPRNGGQTRGEYVAHRCGIDRTLEPQYRRDTLRR
ncbi:MAG: hypothetical protein ABIZ07_01795, partial [Dermatophilaceae bacterium]